jgi:hypothetical protein
MLEGLTEEEADNFLQENPTLVPLYEIDVIKEAEPYQNSEEAAIVELGREREALERELAVSHVDHSALVYLVSKASLTGMLARWTLLLQEYEFDIVHRTGAQHAVADYLSRLESGEAPTGVANDFPNAGVMTVIPETGPRDDPDKWLSDVIYFLSHGVPPEELSKAERKQLGVRSRAFSLMNDSLYHKSADGVWRRVVRRDEQEDVLRECHSGVAGGHYAGDVTTRFGKAGYGGQRCCGTHTYSQRNAICANKRGNHKSRHRCCISPFFRSNLCRNGGSILSAHLNM